jgi:KaiC/GvpD/RAD55 family RecA-like ATPase
MLMKSSESLAPLVKFGGESGFWSMAYGKLGSGKAVLSVSHPEHSCNKDASCDVVLERVFSHLLEGPMSPAN